MEIQRLATHRLVDPVHVWDKPVTSLHLVTWALMDSLYVNVLLVILEGAVKDALLDILAIPNLDKDALQGATMVIVIAVIKVVAKDVVEQESVVAR